MDDDKFSMDIGDFKPMEAIKHLQAFSPFTGHQSDMTERITGIGRRASDANNARDAIYFLRRWIDQIEQSFSINCQPMLDESSMKNPRLCMEEPSASEESSKAFSLPIDESTSLSAFPAKRVCEAHDSLNSISDSCDKIGKRARRTTNLDFASHSGKLSTYP